MAFSRKTPYHVLGRHVYLIKRVTLVSLLFMPWSEWFVNYLIGLWLLTLQLL
jgi:hypothetical protein